MFVDVDGLKHVNDTQGHSAGDALIVDAARVLTGVFRESDVMRTSGAMSLRFSLWWTTPPLLSRSANTCKQESMRSITKPGGPFSCL